MVMAMTRRFAFQNGAVLSTWMSSMERTSSEARSGLERKPLSVDDSTRQMPVRRQTEPMASCGAVDCSRKARMDALPEVRRNS
jgi:hypothetical protein